MEQDFDSELFFDMPEQSARQAMRLSIILHLAELENGEHNISDLEEAASILQILENQRQEGDMELAFSLELTDRIAALRDLREVTALEIKGLTREEAIEAVLDARADDIALASELWNYREEFNTN